MKGSHRTLSIALLLSLLAHALLFGWSPDPAVTQRKVINARLLNDKALTPDELTIPLAQNSQPLPTSKPAVTQTTRQKSTPATPSETSLPDTATTKESPKRPQKTAASLHTPPQSKAIVSEKETVTTSQHINQQTTGQLSAEVDIVRTDPRERTYQQQLLAYFRQKLIAPKKFKGRVRVEIIINYQQIITDAYVINSSGQQAIDNWVLTAVIASNPLPKIPDGVKQPFIFRPTFDLQ